MCVCENEINSRLSEETIFAHNKLENRVFMNLKIHYLNFMIVTLVSHRN